MGGEHAGEEGTLVTRSSHQVRGLRLGLSFAVFLQNSLNSYLDLDS